MGKEMYTLAAKLGAVAVGTVVVLAIIYVAFVKKKKPEGFVSQEAMDVYKKSNELFTKSGGNCSYSEYKSKIPETDAVQHDELRSAWKKHELTPKLVQEKM